MRGPRHARRALAAAAALVVVALTAAPVAAQERTPPPWLNVQDGVTQPVFSFANAIEETVYVESEVDSDGDGRKDRVRIRISRPAETATQGIKVPVVFEHSPYRGDLGGLPNHNVDLDTLPQETLGKAATAQRRRATASTARARARARARLKARLRPDLPSQLDNYCVPRGTPSSSARASAPSTPTAARTWAAASRRSAPRP